MFSTFLGTFAYSQQSSQWYFGSRAGISFNSTTGQPVPLKIIGSDMLADEGSASVSDSQGRILFYTNGEKVYNKRNLVMLNGDDLGGNISSCQSSIIIPVPGNDSIFYIFTSDAVENNFQNGYNYSIVNINRDNGNGEVILKKAALSSFGSERLTAARHRNGIDVWVITNDKDSDIFKSWLITCTGLQPNPVISKAGEILNHNIVSNTGYMKVSPDGTQLCQTHFPLNEPDLAVPNFFQLFDFNNVTGQITNARKIAFGNAQYNSCEFSPDSRLLYLARPYDKKIDQLEAKLSTTLQIASSTISISTTKLVYALQLGPDDKIYAFKQAENLDVIQSPNIKGLGCNYQEDKVELSPFSGKFGSPSFINEFGLNPDNDFSYSIIDSCAGRVQFNAFTNMPPNITWHWDFGDGTTSSLQNPIHIFIPSSRTYNVILKLTSSTSCGKIQQSSVITPSGFIRNMDFDFAVRCDSGYVRFINKNENPGSTNSFFTWNFGDGNSSSQFNPTHSYGVAGNYFVKLKYSNGNTCFDDSLTKLVNVMDFQVKVPPDQSIMPGESVFLSTDFPADSYQWEPSSWLSATTIRNPVATPLEDITYKLTALNNEGCKGEDSIRIKVIQYQDIFVPTAFTPNDDGKNDVIRPFYSGTIQLKDFSVYNRWGQRVFSTSQRNVGWNGQIDRLLQKSGVYAWTIIAIDKSGNFIERKGTFVLIR